MKAKELKKFLKNVPDNAEVVFHLDSRGGRAYRVHMAKHFEGKEIIGIPEDDYDAQDEAWDRIGLPYDGNGLLEARVRDNGGVVVLADWEI